MNALNIPIFNPYPIVRIKKLQLLNKLVILSKTLFFSLCITLSNFKACRCDGGTLGFDSKAAIMIIEKMVQTPAIQIKRISSSCLISDILLLETRNGVIRKLQASPNWEANKPNPEIKDVSERGNQNSDSFEGKFERYICEMAHTA